MSERVLATQPQYGDESTRVPKSSNYNHINTTNITNVYQTLSKGQANGADEQPSGLGHQHQGSRFQSFDVSHMIQKVSIFNTGRHMGRSPILAFVHPVANSHLKGFYDAYTKQSFNVSCPCPKPMTGPLQVSHIVQIKHDLVSNYVNIHSDEVMKLAQQSHTDFYSDISCQKLYNCSYERHIVNIIDELILRGSDGHDRLNTDVQNANVNDVNMDLQSCTNTDTNNKQSSIPLNLGANFPCDIFTTQVRCDISIPDKQFGFLNHQPPNFVIGNLSISQTFSNTHMWLMLSDRLGSPIMLRLGFP